MLFKFKREDDKFIWESPDIKLEFSNPSFQAFNDNINVTSTRQIMYFYYTVKVFRKIYDDWDEEKDEEILKWDLVCERDTHDFPTILQLKEILKYMKDVDTKEKGQKIEYRSGKVSYRLTLETEGFACDDFYELTKITDDKGKNSYIFYMGTTFDSQGDLNSAGIRTPYLNDDDIKELNKCVNSFLRFTINNHNEAINRRNEVSCNDKVIKNNKLYIYEYDDEQKKINENRILSILLVGDTIDIDVLVRKDKKWIDSKDYNNVKIIEFKNDSFVIDNHGKKVEISLNRIGHLFNETPDKEKEILNLSTDEIYENFKKYLSNEEIDDFKTLSERELLLKYKDVIIDSVWMCRSEHKLFDLEENKGNHENVIANVRYIIKKLIDFCK